MSTSLIVLIPAGLLAIVGLLCFAGCTLDKTGLPGGPFTQYTGKTILPTPSIIAYWPLGETADTQPAAELISGNTGNYIDPLMAPALYPWPLIPVPNPGGPDIPSAAATGMISFTQPGLVKGDAVQPGNDPAVITPCVVVNGCYVEVLFNTKFIPQSAFTIEAWVRPDWDSGATHGNRFVLDSRDINPGTGFALFAKVEDDLSANYRWAGMIGNGGAGADGFSIVTTVEGTIPLGSTEPTYLALTYDGMTLTLFVDGQSRGTVTPPTPYMPNSTQPLWIGAAAPYVPRRPQPAGVVGSPLFPFVGAIQDVAIYSAALGPDTILLHFHNGQGSAS
jgi:hypothetical protein